MVRLSRTLMKEAGNGLINKTLSQILVCPLSKQPLRFCEKTNSLISYAIGVSFPIKDGIPCLDPKDGKILELDDDPKPEDSAESSVKRKLRMEGGLYQLLVLGLIGISGSLSETEYNFRSHHHSATSFRRLFSAVAMLNFIGREVQHQFSADYLPV